MGLFSKDIMYQNGSSLICQSLYEGLSEIEKDKWIMVVPDYNKLEAAFKKAIKENNLTTVEMSVENIIKDIETGA